jgi:hypothetical protein
MLPTSGASVGDSDQGLNLGLGSPAPFYMTGEDNLRLRSLNSAAGVTLTVSGRLFGRGNRVVPFSFNHVPNTNRTGATTLQGIGEGWVMGLQVIVSAGTPLIGQCWAIVEIVRGLTGAAIPLGALTSGYVTTQQPITWPGTPAIGTLGGPGVIRSIAGTDPAANTEFSETVPTGARWELLALQVVLADDANVINRMPKLVIDDGTTSVFISDPGAGQAAASTTTYVAGAGTTRLDKVSTTSQWSLPVGLMLMAGYRIRSSTLNLQVGDNYGAPQLLVREWLEGA